MKRKQHILHNPIVCCITKNLIGYNHLNRIHCVSLTRRGYALLKSVLTWRIIAILARIEPHVSAQRGACLCTIKHLVVPQKGDGVEHGDPGYKHGMNNNHLFGSVFD